MPTSLTEQQHLDGIAFGADAFARHARAAGLHAPVATCPGWTVRDLLAHQGMVHRWAAATLRGEKSDTAVFEAAGQVAADPVAWLQAGADELIATLKAVPADVPAPVFLKDPPSPRAFWARRQCHETLIHAADAISAELGRAPSVTDFPLGADLAADGIDELLTGFLPRSRSGVHSERPTTLVIAPQDRDEWWEVSISGDPVVTTRRGGRPAGEADWTVSGHAAELYLRLWHRLDVVEDPAGWPPNWHENFCISWS